MWWKDTVFYQVYLPGFKDSNRDGMGDLNGLISELPYLADLGIGAIWLTPFYPSPMVDNGYDISDYRGVNPLLGNMEDFDSLIREGESRGLKIIIDMVLNHTSTSHRWFREARSSLSNPRRNWYIWRSELPNNWESFFGGSAWEQDPATGEYYYHAFAREMADLNWECREVRQAMYDVLRFWLEKGIKGFRLDVINFLKAGLTWEENNPETTVGQNHIQDMNSPGLPGVLQEIREIAGEYEDIYLLGEVGSENPEVLASYAGPGLLDGVFNFNLGSIRKLNYSVIREELESMSRLYTSPGNEITLFFSNHDMSRFATRLCGGSMVKIKGLAVLLLTAPGVPFLYQGDELGILDYSPDSPEDLFDAKAIQYYRESLFSGLDENNAFEKALERCRDYSRALYLASTRKNRIDKKSAVPTFPPFGEELRKDQEGDEYSILNWIRLLINLRNRNRIFREGDFNPLDSSPDHLIFSRRLEDEMWIIGINNRTRPILLRQTFRTDRIFISRPGIPGNSWKEADKVDRIPGETAMVFRVQ